MHDTYAPGQANAPFPAERILIGITGSIAATMLAPGLLWMRQMLGIKNIRIVMTNQAAKMVPPPTLAALTREQVYTDWEYVEGLEIPHVAITQWAEIFIVMPATANIIAKAAHGIGDDLLSTCVLAARCPVIFAPSMNAVMWEKSAVKRNVEQLRQDGYSIILPVKGFALSDDQFNEGAMAPIPAIMSQAARILLTQRQGEEGPIATPGYQWDLKA